MKLTIPRILRPSKTKFDESEKEAIRSAQALQNEAMLKLLKQLVEESKIALEANKHEKVGEILQDIVLHDLNLRKIISGQLTEKITLSQITLQNSIELESYYNLTRSKILISIVDYLLQGMEKVKSHRLTEPDYAEELFIYYRKVYDFYLGGLAFLMIDESKDQEFKMYQDCKIAFEPVEQEIKERIGNVIST